MVKVVIFFLYHYQLVKGKAVHYQVITFYLKGNPLTRIMFNDLLLVRNPILYQQSECQNVTPHARSFMQMQKQPKQDLVLCSFASDKKEASKRLKMQDARKLFTSVNCSVIMLNSYQVITFYQGKM